MMTTRSTVSSRQTTLEAFGFGRTSSQRAPAIAATNAQSSRTLSTRQSGLPAKALAAKARRARVAQQKRELLSNAGYVTLAAAKKDLGLRAADIYQLLKNRGPSTQEMRDQVEQRLKEKAAEAKRLRNQKRRAARALNRINRINRAKEFGPDVVTLQNIMQLLDDSRITSLPQKEPFQLTMHSAIARGVSHTFSFSNFWNFENWLKMQDGSNEIRESGEEHEVENRGVFAAFTFEISSLSGGRDNTRSMDREFKTPYFTFKVFDPKSKNNNCGIAVLGSILGTKLDAIKARADLGIRPGLMLTPGNLAELYRLNGGAKQLVVVTDDFDGNLLLEESDAVLFHNEHYYHVKEAVRLKLKNKKTKHGNLYWDIETRPSFSDVVMIGNTKSYMLRAAILSIVWKDYKSDDVQRLTFKSDADQSCVEKFKSWLTTQSARGKTYHCVSHNGSRFDHYLLFSTFNENDILESKLQLRGTSMIGLQYKSHLFKDSCCFLVNSLANLCKGYCTTDEERQYSKIEEFTLHGVSVSNTELCFYKPELDYLDFLELETQDPEFWSLYVKYCEYDCLSLRIVWEKFVSQANAAIEKMGPWILRKVTATSCNTIGSLSKKLIDATNNFGPHEKYTSFAMERYLEFIGDDREKYNFVKQFKRGGISHCNQPGKHNEGVMGVDITSQYPTAMMNMEIPCGKSCWVTEEMEEGYGFYELKDCSFDGKLFKPVAEAVVGKSLNWASNFIPTLFVDTWMLEYLKTKCGLVSYTVVKGLVSFKFVQGAKLFNRYVGTLYAEKEKQDELKEAKDPAYNVAYREVVKLLLNSVTGKMNEDPSVYFQLNFDLEACEELELSTRAINGVEFGKDNGETESKINHWIVAGVMIYSYSKRLLFEYINCLPNQSDDVIHVETDGIYFALRHKETFVKNLAEYSGPYQEVVLGSTLGSVKIEIEQPGTSYWLGKKFYYIKTVHKSSPSVSRHRYNDAYEINYAESKIRIKGIPCQTIDKHGRTVNLVNEQFFKDVYSGIPVTTKFSAINKMLFNSNRSTSVALSTYTMSRTTVARMEYKEYF